MTTTHQSSRTFCAELVSLGLEIPDDTTEIEILASGYKEVVEVLFTVYMPEVGGRLQRNTLNNKTTGKALLANEFYELMKDVVTFPDNVENFRITAKPGEIVELTTWSGLPQGTLKCLSDYQLA